MLFLYTTLLLATIVGRSLSQISPTTIPNPVTPVPIYHVGNELDVYVTQDFDGYFCTDLYFTNDGPFDSTHWSAYFVVRNVDAVTDVWTGASEIRRRRNTEFVAILRSAENEGAITMGGRKKLGLCAEKIVADVTRVSIEGQIVLTAGLTHPPLPIDTEAFAAFTTQVESDRFDDCADNVPFVHDFQVIVQNNVEILSGIITGAVLTGGDFAVGTLFRPLGYEQCGCQVSGDFGGATLVVGGSVSVPAAPTEPKGICGGFYTTSAVAPGSPLALVNSTCGKQSQTAFPDLDAAFEQYRELSRRIAAKPDTGLVAHDSQRSLMELFFNENEFAPRQAVISIPGSVLTETEMGIVINSVATMAAHDIVVFNVRGTDVAFNFFDWSRLAPVKAKIVWNMAEAQIVHITDGATIYGTILAPNADVVSSDPGTKVYGSLIAKSFVSDIVEFYQGPWAGFAPEGVDRECYMCSEGAFGSACSTCPDCPFNERCDEGSEHSGECICRETFNDACDDCREGNFGPQCESLCQESCTQHGTCNDGLAGNGSCTCSPDLHFAGEQCDECLENWVGEDCDVCAPGYYGLSCENQCTATCTSNGRCNDGLLGNGSCICTPPFGGEDCSQCLPGYYGANCQFQCLPTCTRNGQCNDGLLGDGSCSNCTVGFVGDQCDECEDPLAYGPGCLLVCNPQCQGTCDAGPDGSGRCLCPAGFNGRNCDQSVTASAGRIVFASYLVFLLVLWYFFV